MTERECLCGTEYLLNKTEALIIATFSGMASSTCFLRLLKEFAAVSVSPMSGRSGIRLCGHASKEKR